MERAGAIPAPGSTAEATAAGAATAADEPDALDTVLRELLDQHPFAVVSAIDSYATLTVMPPTVPVKQHRVLQEGSILDLVTSEDRVLVVRLFAQARERGLATVAVHSVDDPEQAVSLCMVDARRRYGVMLALLVGPASADVAPVAALVAPLPPRLARAHKDASAVFTGVDDAFVQILGWKPDEVTGRRSLELVHPADHELAIASWMEMLEGGPARRIRLRHRHRNGGWVWLEITNLNRLGDPEHRDVLADMVDISDEMAVHELLHQREQLLYQLAETVPLGLLHTDTEGRIVFANSTLHAILGTAPGDPLERLLDVVVDEDRDALQRATEEVTAGSGSADVELRLRCASGAGDTDLRYGSLRLRALHSAAGELSGVTGCLEDVTDTVRMHRALEIQATHDPLTGCRNRAATLDVLSAVLLQHGRQGDDTGTAIAFIDVDRMKPINDRLGHRAGDHLLQAVAARLREAVRAGDIVGRIGGDEFLVICPRVRRGDVTRIGLALSRRLGGMVDVPGGPVELRASVGLAWSSARHADAEQLVAAADDAMYSAKRSGDGRPVVAASQPADEAPGREHRPQPTG